MKERIIGFLLEQMTPTEDLSEHEHKRDQVLILIEKYDILETKKKVNCFSHRQKILLAAGLILVISLSIIFNARYSKLSNDKIFATYYESYKTNDKLSRFPKDNDFTMGLTAYNDGNYNKAIRHFNKLTEADSTNINAYFLLSVSLMQNKAYTEAINKLSYILDKDDCIREQSEWYLALCYLKTGQTNKSIPLFKDLASQNYYQKEANRILKVIK